MTTVRVLERLRALLSDSATLETRRTAADAKGAALQLRLDSLRSRLTQQRVALKLQLQVNQQRTGKAAAATVAAPPPQAEIAPQ